MNGFDLSTISNCYIGSTQVSAIYLGSNLIWSGIDYEQQYLTFKTKQQGSFQFTNTLEYSIDNGQSWHSLAANTSSPTLATGSYIMWRGNLVAYTPDGIGTFSSTCEFDVSGNIMSLVYSNNFVNEKSIQYGNQFHNLFNSCIDLISAENLILPATSLASYCYVGMFLGCTSLTTAPKILPATTLSLYCYNAMFLGCTSLTTAPELPATTLSSYCYKSMFEGCTSLTTAPELPATTLVNCCYQWMFDGCTSLNNIKCLALDISAAGCTDSWLRNVSSTGTFTKAASMTNWTTGSDGIPSGWTVQNYGPGPTPHDYSQDYLTFEALESNSAIGFSTNDIQYSLDNGTNWVTLPTTSSIASIEQGDKVLFKASGLTPTSSAGIGTFSCVGNFNVYGNIMSLVYGDNFANATTISNTYQFYNLFKSNQNSLIDASNLILPVTTLTNYCYSNMFRDCSSLTGAPKLPATTLAIYCYNRMFYGCTSLTSAPELPATTLVSSCYYMMFYGCTSLNSVKCLATNISSASCTMDWLKNVASSGTFVKAASMTSWPTSTSGIPSGWTVQDAS